MTRKYSVTHEDDRRVRGLIKAGTDTFAELSAGAPSGADAFLLAGPAGAAMGGLAGAAVSLGLRRLGSEITRRKLSRREEARVGCVLALGAAQIRNRIEGGESLRSDGFFDSRRTGRSDAEEVMESVLLRSQREPQERKLPHMAALLSGVAFDASVSGAMAHQLTKAAGDLTFRQLCILRIAVDNEGLDLRDADYRGQGSFAKEQYQVLYECLDLYNRGFVNFGGEVAFGPTDVKPGSMTVQGLGVDIYNLMRLNTIPREDIVPIAIQLA